MIQNNNLLSQLNLMNKSTLLKLKAIFGLNKVKSKKVDNEVKDYKFEKRRFSKREKRIFLLLSGNMCKKCGVILNNNFHADHIKPFSKKGRTILNNGQALCAKCNLEKGAKYE